MIIMSRPVIFRIKYNIIYRFSFFLVISLLAVLSCEKIPNPKENALLTVGNQTIGEAELKKDLIKAAFEMGITKDDLINYLDPLLQRVIDIYLIYEYGESHGIHLSETEFKTAVREFEADYPEDVFKEMLIRRFIDYRDWKDEFRKQLLLQKIISSALKDINPVTIEEIKHYFDTHQEEFRHGEMVKIRQIITSTRKDAANVLVLLKEGQKWEELAQKFSIAPEAEKGGMIGWISRGVLEESMEKVVFSLKVGQPSSVIKTPYGFHIFEVLKRQPEGEKSLPEAMAEIESKLSQSKRDALYQDWLQDLKQKTVVKINYKIIKRLEFS